MSKSNLIEAAHDLQGLIDSSPYLSWLGIKVTNLQSNSIEARASFRHEWVANPAIGQTQGGVIAALLDFAASFSLVGSIGRPAFTVDLRFDYHRVAKGCDLIAKGHVIKLGKQVSTCEAQIFNPEERLIASGRGTFLTG